MITEKEFYEIEDKKERFELSMLYLFLHSFPPYFNNLSIESLRSIWRAVTNVQNHCVDNIKDHCEYINIKVADMGFNGIHTMMRKSLPSGENRTWEDDANEYMEGVKNCNDAPTWDLIQSAFLAGMHQSLILMDRADKTDKT